MPRAKTHTLRGCAPIVLFMTSVSTVAIAQNYTKCEVPNPALSGVDLCLPTTNGTTQSLTFVRAAGTSRVVGVIPVKNCRTANTEIRGGISIGVDSSDSMKDTDPNNLRLSSAASVLRSMQSNAQSTALSTASGNYPRVSVVSYGGRQSQTVVDGNGNTVYESDGLNIKTTPVYCKSAEGTEVDAYPTNISRWLDKTGSSYISRCELLLPFLASTSSAADSQTPGIERSIGFLDYTGKIPRGATDLTYLFQAFARSDMLGNSSSTARNAILITDGLPNIPKRVAKSTCEQKSYLRNGEVYTSENGTEYCLDRQFRLAANSANEYLENSANKFDTINLHTILFLGSGKGYIDVDDQGELNPADFLIEASARTGNGKVKFKLAKSEADITNYITDLFENFSSSAVQRVEIKVNSNPKYAAVSPGKAGQLFSLKFINLQDGANTVVVTTYYTDLTVSKTFQVNVVTSGSPTSPYSCTEADGTKTVDGDDPSDKTPNGDGVLPEPAADGSGQRVFRNSDPENDYDLNDFLRIDEDALSDRTRIENGQLRLQGGTGNCGVVAGIAHQSSSAMWFLLLAPLLVFLTRKSKRNLKKNFLVILFCLACAKSFDARAVGLNSENFVPSPGRASPLLWENPETLNKGGLIYGYTFDYSLHPVEFGDGSERIGVSNHLQVNHFSLAYGVLPFLTVSGNLPLSFYSAPDDVDGAIRLDSRSRNSFFLGDLSLSAQFTPQMLRGVWYAGGLIVRLALPTGAAEAMLSDDAIKVSAFMPWSFFAGDWEPYFGVGMSAWQNEVRVESGFLLNDGTDILLRRSLSLLLNTGARYWLQRPSKTGADGIKLEAGLRADYSDFKPTFNSNESPMEWAVGGAYYLDSNWSFHGSIGGGIAKGVGAPLTRIVAGVRYTDEPLVDEEDDEVMLTSEAYSERDLDEILRQAQSEAIPPRLEEDDSLLRLMTSRDEVVDLGTVRFEFNSARLTPEARQTVKRLYEYLQRLNPRQVRIDGHTDSIGSYTYNLALSKRRAQSVRDELIRLGWRGRSILTEGFSYKYPVASNATSAGRAQNRRIEVALDGRSFRKSSYSRSERRQIQEWIAPGGRKPSR